ncbi:MAG: lamin tail domain-containing protein [Pseudomonadota bacterium]
MTNYFLERARSRQESQRRTATSVATAAALGALLPLQAAVADLVINEIDYDQPGGDSAEFIELKNVSGATVNLDAYSLELVNGSGGGASIYQTVDLPAVSVDAGSYYVLCEDASTVPGCDLDILSSVQNGGPDAVGLRLGATLVDTVSYEGDTAAPYTEGSGNGLVDPNNIDLLGISRVPDGTDTNVNNVDLQTVCITPGAANSATSDGCQPPAAEKIVINEVDYDQGVVDDAEFVELFSSGNVDVALASLTLEFVNGTTGVVENSVSLGSGTLTAGTYFVVCINAASTANCDLDVAGTADLIGDAGPRAVALRKDGTLIDTVSYGGDSVAPYTEGSGAGLVDSSGIDDAGISRFPNGADSDLNNVDFSLRCATPGEANTAISSNCDGGDGGVEIFAIQGAGLSSPLEGQMVTTTDNIVTAVGTDGFFIQTPTARSDGNPETSDGIFVFTGGAPSVNVGDQVDVSGEVIEFFDLTEISGFPLVSVDSSGNPLPPVVTFDATMPSPDRPQPDNELERFEGMLVTFSGMASAPSDRFGDVPVVASTQRPFREPGIEFPGLPGLPVWDGNPQVFDLNPDELGFPDESIFATQTVTATGPLAFSFGDYQVLPTSLSLGPEPALPRAVRPAMPGEFSIATYNMLRLFDSVDDPLTDDPIVDPAELEIRLDKFSFFVRETLNAPDIVAVQEVENVAVLNQLILQIAIDEPGLIYKAWLIEGNDVGGIDVGYLTRADTIAVDSVSQFGENTILDFDGSLLNDRPPLILEATYTGGGETFDFTVINVHQRSLGGIDGSEAERVKTKRLEQAVELAELVQDLQTADPQINLIVTGDFNAFEFTDGYVDVMGQVTGALDPLGDEFGTTDIVNPDLYNHVLDVPADDRYSFVFGGSAQVLDHTLTSSAVTGRVTDAMFARGNADAPDSLNLVAGASIGVRASDHDAFVVYINAGSEADSDGDGIADSADNCINDANPLQIDSNGDNIGNVCDADIAGPAGAGADDCLINFFDLGRMKDVFFTNDPDADLVGPGNSEPDGSVSFFDLGRLKELFFQPPGPSAAGCN